METKVEQPGVFRKGWIRLFGQEDEIDREVRQLEHQGSHAARVAHAVANGMIVLVSTATVITLGLQNLNRFVASLEAGHPDIIGGISLATLFLLVLCMDVAMIYGTMRIRLLASRRAEWTEVAIHWVVVSVVAVVESMTYYAMIMHYDPPTTAFDTVLVYARSFLAPALAIYLSSADTLGIMARDILNIGNRRSGIKLLRQIAAFGQNGRTGLGQTFAVFQGTATLGKREEEMLQRTFTAIMQWTEPALNGPTVEADSVPLAPAYAQRSIPQPAPTPQPIPPAPVPTPPIPPLLVSAVVPSRDREQYKLLIAEQLKADASLRPSVIAATLGISTDLVCAYMAETMKERRRAVQHV